MKNMLIRNLPDDVHWSLKQRAASNGHSLQREVHLILSEATREYSTDVAGQRRSLDLHMSNADLQATIDRQEIYRDYGERTDIS